MGAQTEGFVSNEWRLFSGEPIAKTRIRKTRPDILLQRLTPTILYNPDQHRHERTLLPRSPQRRIQRLERRTPNLKPLRHLHRGLQIPLHLIQQPLLHHIRRPSIHMLHATSRPPNILHFFHQQVRALDILQMVRKLDERNRRVCAE